MRMLVGTVGFVVMAIGVNVLVNPNMLKMIMNFWGRGNRVYLAGGIKILLGFLFLMASPACKSTPVITMFGVLIIISGIFILVIGKKRAHAIFDWWKSKPPGMIRGMGLIALLLGALIFYSS